MDYKIAQLNEWLESARDLQEDLQVDFFIVLADDIEDMKNEYLQGDEEAYEEAKKIAKKYSL